MSKICYLPEKIILATWSLTRECEKVTEELTSDAFDNTLTSSRDARCTVCFYGSTSCSTSTGETALRDVEPVIFRPQSLLRTFFHLDFPHSCFQKVFSQNWLWKKRHHLGITVVNSYGCERPSCVPEYLPVCRHV